MDKFLKKISEEDFRKNQKSKRPQLKQATIASLPGVLDLRRIVVIKEQLLCKNKAATEIIKLLSEIKQMQIKSVYVLTETGLGHSIGPLRKHSDIQVSILAKELINGWKTVIANLPVTPVINKSNCADKLPIMLQNVNSSSDKVRKKAVTLIFDNSNSIALESAKSIEKEIFVDNGMKIDKQYKQKIRQKVFQLRKESSVQD